MNSQNDNDSSSGWRDEIEEVLRRQRQWQEQINKLLYPQRQWQEQLNKLLEPQRQLREQMDRGLEPLRQQREEINRLLQPQRQWQEQISRLLESQGQWQRQMGKVLEFQKQLRDQIDRLLEPQRQWQEEITRLLSPQRQLQEQLRRLIQPEVRWKELVETYLSDLQPDSIEVDTYGSIAIGEVSFSSGEVASELDLLSQEIETATTFAEFLIRLASYLQRLGRPLAQILLLTLLPYVISVFANLTTPIYEQWWAEYTDNRMRREVAKSIRQDASVTYDASQLRDHRFVIVTRLNVRAASNMKSKVLDALPLGKVVKVLKKDKQRTFIEYIDDDTDTLRRGWVFSKYLARFNK